MKIASMVYSDGKNKEKFYVELRTLNDDYARYRATANQQQNISDDPFAQPIQVHNNIINGVGIFAGLTSTEYLIHN